MNIIFIDVDGVLNCLGQPRGTKSYLVKLAGYEYQLYLNPEHGKWLTDLAEDTGSELIWGTTWERLANTYIASKVGLPELPFLDLSTRKFSETLGSVKAKKAVEYADGRKFVYFDDEYDLGYGLEGSNGHHIYVEPYTGLTLEHLETARQYLKN